MSIKFTNEDPSYEVNKRLIMDRIKISQEYNVVLFTESSNRTAVSPAIKRKIRLNQGMLKIEGIPPMKLKLCRCEWKNETLSIYPQDNFSVDIHFD